MFREVCLGIAVGVDDRACEWHRTRSIPARGQQIPAPVCMSLHNAWEGNQLICPAVHARAMACGPAALAE